MKEIVYHPIKEDDKWKVPFILEILDAMNNEEEVTMNGGWSEEELKEILGDANLYFIYL